MGYTLEFSTKAKRDLKKLSPGIATRILQKLAWLRTVDDPVRFGKVLQGKDGVQVRFRIGKYRVIATVDTMRGQAHLTIVRIQHRKDVYR